MFFISCNSQTPEANRGKANFFNLPEPELGETWDAENERQAENILAITKDMVDKKAVEDGMHSRDAHPKHHACVKAIFKVNSSKLPLENRVGVFAENRNYEAWIRFSNGDPSGEKKHDVEVDVRGMAVKVMQVPGARSGSQDFLMINAREFFSEDGDDYIKLFKALTGGTASLALYGITHPLSAKRLLEARVKLGNVLQADYHSSVPYKLGAHAMRFRAVACDEKTDVVPGSNSDPSYLRQRLITSLNSRGSCFKFFVQRNLDPKKNAVEDPRDRWDEKKSPLIEVASIEIPKQSGIKSAQQMNFCENISMDPWHTHPQTRPLGQINRMRALIYREISKHRHQANRILNMEPVTHNPCVGSTSALCEDPRR